MVNIPASNRIHSLPVVVNYHLPSSSSSFTTLFNSPQQVYVHANAATKSSAEVETWGSIYLKTVVQGVLLASPELHPFESSTPDTSLYVLDPRETYSRRQRCANLPAHLRSDRGSSPAGGPSSPLAPPAPEVWAGKGLLSWALQEAGQGKNLITGRLIRSTEFVSVSLGGLDALEALMANADQEGVWGLKVNLSLRTQGMPMTGPIVALGSAAVMERNASSSSISMVDRRSSVISPALVVKKENIPEIPVPPVATVRPTPLPTRLPPRQPLTAERQRLSSTYKQDSTPSTSRHPKTKPRTSTGKKRKSAASSDQPDRVLNDLSMNSSTLTRVNSYDPSKYLPSIPAAVYHNPSSLTKDQVHRLLASPAFLDLLEKTAGQTLDEAKRNAVSTVVGDMGTAAKRVKHDHADESASGGLKCYNCGRTKSSVWRSREMEDGNTVKVCNACGLYWNQRKEMRPPSLWTAVDEDIAPRPPTSKKKPITRRNTGTATASLPDPNAQDLTSHAAAFKRTLSAVVNQDAERLAARRPHATSSVSAPAATLPRSNLHISKTAPATSPVQPTRPKTMRNASWNNAEGHVASSPGGWVQPNTRAVRANEAFEPMSTIGESPALSSTTTMALAFNTQSQIQSLQLPLSDDQIPGNSWDTDLSTLFDIDAYSGGFDKDSSSQPLRRSPRKHSQRTHIQRHSNSHSDPISNLFTASSSSTAASPKSSFDFSALPPSSPPYMMRENTASSGNHLGHSALLLSSPEFSPLSSMFGPSPVEGPRLTPEKNKSGLRNSFTLDQNFGMGENGQVQGQGQYGLGVGVGVGGGVGVDINPAGIPGSIPNQHTSQQPMMSIEEITQVLNDSGMDQAAWDELFGLINDGNDMNGLTAGGVGQVIDQGMQGFGADIFGGTSGMGGMGGMTMGMTGMETVPEDEWTALLTTLGS